MVSILLKKYKELGKDASKWKLKKRIFLSRMGYNLNKLLIFNWILGYLNMEGHKNWSFSILVNVILLLKKNSKRPMKYFFECCNFGTLFDKHINWSKMMRILIDERYS